VRNNADAVMPNRDVVMCGPFGGHGGARFGQDECYNVWGFPTAVRVRHSDRNVIGVDLVFGYQGVSANGAPDGTVGEFALQPDDVVTRVEVWANEYVGAVRLHTRGGGVSPIFGDKTVTGGTIPPTHVAYADGRGLCAIAGSSGSWMDAISFLFAGVAMQ
jgi:hypothetical protein